MLQVFYGLEFRFLLTAVVWPLVPPEMRLEVMTVASESMNTLEGPGPKWAVTLMVKLPEIGVDTVCHFPSMAVAWPLDLLVGSVKVTPEYMSTMEWTCY